MAIYFKFKSAKIFESIAVPGNYVCIGYLKDIIRKKKGLSRGRDYDLMVYNAQTGEDYKDERAMIPKCTSVLLRRIPGPRLASISVDNSFTTDSSTITTDQGESRSNLEQEESEPDDFGEDVYATPKVDTKTKALVDKDVYATPNIDTKAKALVDTNSFSNGNSGISSGSAGQHGFPRKTPPIGYICHRCKVPGHFIQHCPTNGDPSYNIRKLKPPTAVSRTVGSLPPEFLCPLCRELMKDAAFTKCCFRSFCDNCIRDYLSTKSACVCGSMKNSVDNIVPNVTVREVINGLLLSVSSSSEKSGSMKAEDAESANDERAKVLSPILSDVIKDEPMDSLDENGGGMIAVDGAIGDVKSANNEQLKATSPTLSVRIKEEPNDSYEANKGDTRIKRRLPNCAAADMPRKAISNYATEHSARMCPPSSAYINSCHKGVLMGSDAYASSSDFSRKRMRLI